MLELGRWSCLKISQFSQEPRQLNQNHKYLLVVWTVSWDEALQAPIVLSYWIVLKLLQNLPVLRQLMLGLWIVQNTEDLDARYEVLQSLPISTFLVLKDQLIDLTQRKGLLLNERTNVFAYLILAISNLWVFILLFIISVSCIYQTLTTLLIDVQ